MSALARILIVEDDPNDLELTLTALGEYNLANKVVVTRDGQEALDYLYCRGEFHSRPTDNPLRANDGETSEPLKFSLEGVGQPSHGHAKQRIENEWSRWS